MDEETKREKREYHRKWRAEHPEQVEAAQLRYWMKKARAKNLAAILPEGLEIRKEANCDYERT